MVNFMRTIVCLLLAAFSPLGDIARAQGDAAAGASAALLQEKVREWVRVQKLRGEESADWEEQQRELAALNALRRTEIAQIDELIVAAGARLEGATQQREELRAEQAELRVARAELGQRIGELEAALRVRMASFPPPLQEKIEEIAARLAADGEKERPLQDRYRDVVAVLSAAGEFGRTLSVVGEMREIGGERVEVEVLYLGMAGAWYVDRSGKLAGSGRAAPGGWIWTADRSIAGRVRAAIDMHHKKASPGYVRLPFGAGGGGEP